MSDVVETEQDQEGIAIEAAPPTPFLFRYGKRKNEKLHRRSCTIRTEVKVLEYEYYNDKGIYISPPPLEHVHYDRVGGHVQKGGHSTELGAHCQVNPTFHGGLPGSLLPHNLIPQKKKKTSSSMKYQLVGKGKPHKFSLDIDRMSKLEERIILAAKAWTSRVSHKDQGQHHAMGGVDSDRVQLVAVEGVR